MIFDLFLSVGTSKLDYYILKWDRKIPDHFSCPTTICQRSLDPFNLVSY